ncbi:alanine racemase [Luteimicrobium sp. NPDC057192]|uniref:alanine racemase n=1 Tax=Luteimicrobium sp. NPDC057192 TaxID=3346042 RepID=UPI00364305F2
MSPLPPLPTGAPTTVGRPASAPWATPASYWPALTAATSALDPPYATLDLRALAHNAHDMLRRADGMPIRVASKSVRTRAVLDAVLALDGYAGILAYTLPEALWLASEPDPADPAGGGSGVTDVVVGYPTADRGALRRLVSDRELASRVTIMVDDVAQLDLVDAVARPGEREEVRVCLELDASYDLPGLSALAGAAAHVGVFRSPVHSPERAQALARLVAERPGFRLVGVMAYEAQIAGLANATPGRAARSAVVRRLQALSGSELLARRGAAVAAVRQVADLEFVNGGGTGSLETTSADPAVTEVAAGSGLFGPHLFDNYAQFTPAPAVAFALSVVRNPAPGVATLLGGGWVASGPPAADRLPRVVWPEGTRYVGNEAAGEVQTPLRGPGAADLRPGDRAWLRHTKAGEIAEHVDELVVVGSPGDHPYDPEGPATVLGSVPTYRGERKVFL